MKASRLADYPDRSCVGDSAREVVGAKWAQGFDWASRKQEAGAGEPGEPGLKEVHGPEGPWMDSVGGERCPVLRR